MRIRRVAATSAATLATFAVLVVAACSSGSSPVTSPTPTPTPTPTPGTGGTGGSTAPTFTDVKTQILTPICSGCHSADGQAPAGGLNMTSTVAWGNLVNAPSSGKSGAIRVIPGDPDNSYLVQKLEGAAGIVGLRMPRNGPPYLTDAQIALVRQWIAAGALNN
jgi:hypothetical protein